jgi:hypothetical protein
MYYSCTAIFESRQLVGVQRIAIIIKSAASQVYYCYCALPRVMSGWMCPCKDLQLPSLELRRVGLKPRKALYGESSLSNVLDRLVTVYLSGDLSSMGVSAMAVTRQACHHLDKDIITSLRIWRQYPSFLRIYHLYAVPSVKDSAFIGSPAYQCFCLSVRKPTRPI